MTNSIKPEKILIAGGSGMVGNAIKNLYFKKLSTGKYQNKEILYPTRTQLNFLNYSDVERWFEINKPNIVIMAAAKVGGIYANSKYPADFILQNIKMQTNLIEISNKYNIKKFLFLGSSCIYPKFAKQPITESSLLTGPLENTNQFYAIAKIAGIKLCQSLILQNGFNALCLMPTNLFGPRDNYSEFNSHVLPSFIRKFSTAKNNNSPFVKCWGDGTPLREFLYVDDLAEACLFVLENWKLLSNHKIKDSNGEEICWINVGSNSEISIKNLASLIANEINYRGEILWDEDMPNGTPRKKLDTSILDNIGWSSKKNLKDGIKLTINAYNNEVKCNTIRG